MVPVYAITAGRTRSTGHEMPLEALVTTTAANGIAPGGEPMLHRRVPQTHLAPELSQLRTEPAELQPPPSYAARAADALSRFQASRQTAQSEVAEGGVDIRFTAQREGQHRAPGTGGQP